MRQHSRTLNRGIAAVVVLLLLAVNVEAVAASEASLGASRLDAAAAPATRDRTVLPHAPLMMQQTGAQTPNRSWFARNWKWVVPVAAFGALTAYKIHSGAWLNFR